MSTGRKVIHARSSGYGRVTAVRRDVPALAFETISDAPRDQGAAPEQELLLARLHAAVADGRLAWSGQRLRPEMPTATLDAGTTIAELLIEDRRR